jgi:hypothetical protein
MKLGLTVNRCGVSRLTFQTAELGKDNKPAFESVTTVGARSPCFYAKLRGTARGPR